jgi:hypothetical protein
MNMAEADKKEKWLAYAHRLYETGETILREADKVAVGAGLRDPKVLAMALLCRTLCNLNAVVVLIQANFIVEARTITRSCFENLLWLVELSVKQEAFVEEMVRDEVASQTARGKMVLSWGETLENVPSYEEGLRQRIAFLSEKFPDAKAIRFANLGKTNNINDPYMWFRFLSGDSAHPSLTSLGRHFFKSEGGGIELTLIPDPKASEAEQTLEFACQAALGVCVATCEVVGVPRAHAALTPMFDEFLQIARPKSAAQ